MSREKLPVSEEAWFHDEPGAAPHREQRPTRAPRATAALDGRTRGQLLVLGGLFVAVLVAGVALGAFSSQAQTGAVAPAPSGPTAAVQAALEAADRWDGTALLTDDTLFLELDELAAERRSDASPVGPPSSPGDAAAPSETPPSVAAAARPIEEAPALSPIATTALEGASPDTTAKAPPVAVKAPPVAVKAPPVAVKAPPVEVKAPPVAVKAPPVEVKAPPVAVKAPPVEVKAPPVEVKAPPVEVVPAAETPPAVATAGQAERAETALVDAKAKAAKRDWKGAVAAYGEALAASPGDAKALAGRGQAHYEQRQLDAATKDLEAVLAQNPTHAAALLTLGSIAQEQGKKPQARAYYERYLKRYPNGRRATEVRALIDAL